MNEGVAVRFAKIEDAEALIRIYEPYVLQTAVSFEYEVPSIEEFAGRMRKTQEKFPYLVAEHGGEIAGYAYAGSFGVRAAYDWSVETSIYLKENKKKLGLGKTLYEALETILREMNICNLNACIAYPDAEDEHLTTNSADFHAHLGYRMVGEFHKCGYKFGRWYNMVWMEKMISEHQEMPPAVLNINENKGLLKEKYGIE